MVPPGRAAHRVRHHPRHCPGGGNVSPGNGHGFIAYGGGQTADPVQIFVDYEEDTREEFEARPGPRARMLNPIVGTVFPNFSVIKTNSHSFRVWHPKGPNSIEFWAWAFTGRAAPPEVKETIRKIAAFGFSPSGTFEQDDMDNWQEYPRTSRGLGQALRNYLRTGRWFQVVIPMKYVPAESAIPRIGT